jgi:hypothetical protein
VAFAIVSFCFSWNSSHDLMLSCAYVFACGCVMCCFRVFFFPRGLSLCGECFVSTNGCVGLMLLTLCLLVFHYVIFIELFSAGVV